MDKDEIKQRLSGYLPEIYAEDDPEISEALRLAKEDVELSAWLDEEVSFNQAFGAALGQLPIDDTGLAAGMEEFLSSAETKISDVPAKRSMRRLTWAIAAILLLAGVLTKYFVYPPAVQFPEVQTLSAASFRDQMAFFATERFVLDKSTTDLAKAQAWLETKDYPVFDQIPGTIVSFKGMGCKAINWHGSKVGLVCFLNDRKELVHLFIWDADDVDAIDDHDLRKLARAHGLETQGWRDQERHYVYVGADPEVSLAGLL